MSEMKNFDTWPEGYIVAEYEFCKKEMQAFEKNPTCENARDVLSKRQEFARCYIGVLNEKLQTLKKLLGEIFNA